MRSTGKSITITVNNLAVNYNDQGPDERPAIIFIHGFPLNKDMWKAQEDELKKDYRVITYDIRGHGNSPMGDEDFSMELFADDIIHFMDHLQLPRAALCGLSMGGYIALTAIEKWPERFEALILCDTQCAADTQEAKEKRKKTIEFVKEKGVAAYAEENINNFFAPGSLLTKKDKVNQVSEMIKNTSAETIIAVLHALKERNETCHHLPDIKVPVLILVGMEDKITPTDCSRLMKEKIKDVSYHIIGGAGHLSNMEKEIEFNDELKKFLDGVFDISEQDENYAEEKTGKIL